MVSQLAKLAFSYQDAKERLHLEKSKCSPKSLLSFELEKTKTKTDFSETADWTHVAG